MSDVAIVAAVALLSAGIVTALWLQQRERALIRAEQRDERERGAFPKLVERVEAVEAGFKKAHSEQVTFLANARR